MWLVTFCTMRCFCFTDIFYYIAGFCGKQLNYIYFGNFQLIFIKIQLIACIKSSFILQNRDKDRPETNNEQRLPLKKRHYHISTPPTLPSAESVASPKPDPNQESSKPSAKSVAISSSEKSTDKTLVAGNKSGSSGSKVASTPVSGKTIEKQAKVEIKVKVDGHRNSIDEAIEATITRYAHESRSVIVTPKKRHRLEMEKKSGTSPVVRNSSASKAESGSVGSPLPTKRVSSRSSSTNNQPPRTVSPSPAPSNVRRTTSRSVSKQETVLPRQRSGSRGSAVVAGEAVIPVPTATPAQSVTKRANTRSSDMSVQPVVALGKRASRLAASADKPIITSATQAVLNKRATREKAATVDITPATAEPVKPITHHVGLLSTRSAAKITPDATLISPIPLLESNPSKSLRLRSNKPPAGVFEPSSKADELMSLVGISPAVVNKMDSVLNQLSEKLKNYETSDTLPTPLLKLDESHNGRNRPKRLLNDSSSGDEEKKLKKRKVIRDIRVHVTKLSPSDLVLKKVMGVVKAKIRRRNRINRTGFPVKKKKKKKPLETISIGNIQSDIALDKELVMPKLIPDFKDFEKPKMYDINGALHDLPAPVLCMEKIDCIKIKEDDLKLKEEIKEEVSEPKSLSLQLETPEESVLMSQRVKKSEDSKPLTTRLSKKPEALKAETKTKIKTETTINEEKSDKTKVEIRKSSRRLMVLKARQRVEASKRRKRKQGLTSVQGIIPRDKRSPSPDLPPSSPMEIHPPEVRLQSTKRLRKTREDVDKDDR